MTAAPVLLINPRVSSRAHARLPLSLLHLAAAINETRPWQILDGNQVDDLVGATLSALREKPHALVGLTVMPGPQVAPAIAISTAIRAAFPRLPIVWGGYFPSLYPLAAMAAPYVDIIVRGQGEQPLIDLLGIDLSDHASLQSVRGISWKRHGEVVHNLDVRLAPPEQWPALPYERLGNPAAFMPQTFLGKRTAVHQCAVGCRYRCSFCGVASVWSGGTLLDAPTRLLAAGTELRDRWGADSIQFFDHNFFDREETSIPTLEVLERLGLPWWCYARADTLASFAPSTWVRIRSSQLRMVYLGAEAGSDAALAELKKGGRVSDTVEAVRRCRDNNVIPELSFMLGGTEDPESEIESTFELIRTLKTMHPAAEVILYFYSPMPMPPRGEHARRLGAGVRLPVLDTYGPKGPALPTTPEEWTRPEWVRWVCHQDAPWLTERTRQRINDFSRVLSCRFPTIQDPNLKPWGRTLLRNAARLRYATRTYERPWELRALQRAVRLRRPEEEGL